VIELGEDGLITSLLYFDEDDFCSAYGELENRYYAGEGAAYAENGLPSADWVIAITTPTSRASAASPTRTSVGSQHPQR